MTFARQQYYAFEDGKQAGIAEGRFSGIAEGELNKAIEAAVMLVRDFNIEPKLAAEKINAPLGKVMEALHQDAFMLAQRC